MRRNMFRRIKARCMHAVMTLTLPWHSGQHYYCQKRNYRDGCDFYSNPAKRQRMKKAKAVHSVCLEKVQWRVWIMSSRSMLTLHYPSVRLALMHVQVPVELIHGSP